MGLYLITNAAAPTTAAIAPVTTGTSIKTLLQLKPFNVGKIVEWGISFDGFVAALPISVELIDTSTVFATVTASVDADITKYDDTSIAVASVAGLTLGTAATGYTASAEGTITSTRVLDSQLIAPYSQFVKQFPLGREPKIIVGNSTRIRVKAGTAVNALCYMIVEF